VTLVYRIVSESKNITGNDWHTTRSTKNAWFSTLLGCKHDNEKYLGIQVYFGDKKMCLWDKEAPSKIRISHTLDTKEAFEEFQESWNRVHPAMPILGNGPPPKGQETSKIPYPTDFKEVGGGTLHLAFAEDHPEIEAMLKTKRYGNDGNWTCPLCEEDTGEVVENEWGKKCTTCCLTMKTAYELLGLTPPFEVAERGEPKVNFI